MTCPAWANSAAESTVTEEADMNPIGDEQRGDQCVEPEQRGHARGRTKPQDGHHQKREDRDRRRNVGSANREAFGREC